MELVRPQHLQRLLRHLPFHYACQGETRRVRLGHLLNLLNQPRSLPDANTQNARRQRIERARMPDLVRANASLHVIDDITRGDAGRFVNVENTEHG